MEKGYRKSIYEEMDICDANRTHLLLHAYDVHDTRVDEDVHAFLVGTQYEGVYKIETFVLLPDGKLKYDGSIGCEVIKRGLFFKEYLPVAQTAFQKFVGAGGGKVVTVIKDEGEGATLEEVMGAHGKVCHENDIIFFWLSRDRW